MSTIETLTEWFGLRVTKSKGVTIRLHSKALGLRPTEMIRAAVDEYLENHPIPEAPSE